MILKGREIRRGEEGREVRFKATNEWADDRGVTTICIYVYMYV